MNDDKPSSYRKMYNMSKDLSQLIIKENIAYDYWKAKYRKLEKELRSQETMDNIVAACEKNVDLPEILRKKIAELDNRCAYLTAKNLNLTGEIKHQDTYIKKLSVKLRGVRVAIND